jgi:hypothetical protein
MDGGVRADRIGCNLLRAAFSAGGDLMNQRQARICTAAVIVALIAICYGPIIGQAVGIGGAKVTSSRSIR